MNDVDYRGGLYVVSILLVLVYDEPYSPRFYRIPATALLIQIQIYPSLPFPFSNTLHEQSPSEILLKAVILEPFSKIFVSFLSFFIAFFTQSFCFFYEEQ